MSKYTRLLLRTFCMAVPLSFVTRDIFPFDPLSVESLIVSFAMYLLVLGFNATFIYKDDSK